MLTLFRHMLILFVFAFGATRAEVVKWTDESGKVHFGDRAPEEFKYNAKTFNLSDSNIVTNDNLQSYPIQHKRSSRHTTTTLPQNRNNNTSQSHSTRCANAEQRYRSLTTIERTYNKNPKRVTISSYVLKKEGISTKAGEPLKESEIMSRRKQNQHAEKLRKKWNKKGCTINKKPNLKL